MIDETLLDAEERMEKAVEVAREDFGGIRAGRANPQMFQKIVVEYYGVMTPIRDLASISIPEPRMAIISPFDKGSMSAIEKAIREANLGLNPSNDGAAIRLAFPPLTEERRKEFVRMVRAKAEDGRNGVRGARRESRKDLEALRKDGDISDDDLHRAEAELDKLTKRFEAEIEAALEAKTTELLEG